VNESTGELKQTEDDTLAAKVSDDRGNSECGIPIGQGCGAASPYATQWGSIEG
jgi:hypothetical protein